MATVLALNKDLEAELALMNEFARVNLKSYQVWFVQSPIVILVPEINQASPPSLDVANLPVTPHLGNRLHPRLPGTGSQELSYLGVPPLAILSLLVPRAD